MKPPLCTTCGSDVAVYHRPYSGEKLCKSCFIESIEERVRKAICRYDMFEPDDRIAVAVSGGKDSLTLLRILHKIEQRFPKSELIAVSVDEGLGEYRTEALERASRLCRKLGVEHVVRSFKQVFGYTVEEGAELDEELGPCTYCGVFRRRVLNVVARELGADKLVTGHNLDDVAQTILMNLIRGNLLEFVRFGLDEAPHPTLVRRVKPLMLVPEREVAFYAYLTGICFQRRTCPYFTLGFRNEVRNTLNRLEVMHPGIKFSILRGFERLRDALGERLKPSLRECKKCGEPTTGEVCQVCRLLERLEARA